MVRPLDKEGGGRSPKNFFSALRASVWSKNKGGARPPSLIRQWQITIWPGAGWDTAFLQSISFRLLLIRRTWPLLNETERSLRNWQPTKKNIPENSQICHPHLFLRLLWVSQSKQSKSKQFCCAERRWERCANSLPLVILSDEQERTHRRVNFRKPSVLKLREFFNGDLFDHLWVCDYDRRSSSEAHLVNSTIPLKVFPQHRVHSSIFNNIGKISNVWLLARPWNWNSFEKGETSHTTPIEQEHKET